MNTKYANYAKIGNKKYKKIQLDLMRYVYRHACRQGSRSLVEAMMISLPIRFVGYVNRLSKSVVNSLNSVYLFGILVFSICA